MPKPIIDRLRISAEILLAGFAVFVSWNAVRWAFEPGLFLYMDEIGNLTRFINASYWQNISLLPVWIYNDRPVGFVLEQALFDAFGFSYEPQLSVFLAFHFANCVMGFMLFRRLGIGVPLSIAAVGVFAGLWTTAQTVTYIGAMFDVTCLFFLLGSMLTFLSDRRGSTIVSAILFLLALRSKEFAIVLPVLLVFLGLRTLSARSLILKVWPHFLIAIVLGIRYLSFVPRFRDTAGPQDPYHADWTFSTILHSFSYYSALILGLENTAASNATLLFSCILAAIVAYGLWRRNDRLLFNVASYGLLLLPVSALPGIRTPFYVYAPQLFFILAGAILIQDLNERLFKQPGARWVAAMAVSAFLLAWTVHLQTNPAVTNGKRFLLTVRRISAITAQDAQAFIPALLPDTHIYVRHGAQVPWLLVQGPCDYIKLVTRDSSITCSLSQAKDTLETAYRGNDGPKLLLDYKSDGSLSMIAE